jgi:tetratricopeptide (TPR) repeat protein
MVLGLALALLAIAAAPALARKPAAKDLAAAKAHFKQGKAYHEAGAYLEAVKEYEKAYALAALPDLLFNIGQAYRMQGDKPKAIAAYERFLAAVTEGDLADEARAQLAALKLKLQVEAAEAAKRKAQEELAAARRQAAELEAARKRAEAEAAARERAQRNDTDRLRRLAVEEADRRQRRAAAARREHEERLARTRTVGSGLRTAGGLNIALGCLTLVASAAALGTAARANEKLGDWNDSSDRWYPDWQDLVDQRKRYQTMAYATGISGGVVLLAGIILYRTGVARRTAAAEAVTPPVTVTPLVGPGVAGVTLGGRF